MWNRPDGLFNNFKNDSIGKCEVCFRAGFCSMNECSVQKKFEISVINSTVDKAKLNGLVDDKPLKDMMRKIIKNQKINFKKMAKKVQKNLYKAKKHVNKKAEKSLIKSLRILNGVKGSPKKNKLASSKLITIIRSSISKFRATVMTTLSFKSK
jgi:hypothetical protein